MSESKEETPTETPPEEKEKTFTQEEVNAIVSKRVNSLNAEVGRLQEELAKAGEKDSALEELQSQVGTLSTENLKLVTLSEAGLPVSLAKSLSGNTEEEIKEAVEVIKGLSKNTSTQVFRKDVHQKPALQVSKERAAYVGLAKQLKE